MAKAVSQSTTKGDALREAYGARWAAFPAERKGPKALAARRVQAMAAFSAAGFPTPALEAWKKTSLRSLETAGCSQAPAPGSPDDAALDALRLPGAVATLVFVDGRLDAARSDLTGLPAGVTVTGLAQALSRGAALPPRLGHIAPIEAPEHAVAALNTALCEDGAIVSVAKGVEAQGVVQVVWWSATAARQTAVFPRLFIHAAPGAAVTVLETHAGQGSTTRLTAPVTEVEAEATARVHLAREVLDTVKTIHLGTVAAHVARDAEVLGFSFTEGAALARVDVRAHLDGPGASCRLDGVFLADGEQHVDHFTSIDHATPHTTGREVFKGILAGGAHGVFTGHVLVRPGAQATDSEQENRNLLLSDKALVDTTPQLEIHADDVKCRHGSTIGQLRPDQVFYLRSRGIEADAARRILTLAFAQEALGGIPDAGVRERLATRTASWLGRRGPARAEAEKKAGA